MSGLQISSRDRVVLSLLIIGLAGWLFINRWNRPPVVETQNLKYIQLLSTAISNRSIEQLDKVQLALAKRFDEGEMSEKELKSLIAIAEQARAGEWDQAHRKSFALAEGQLRRKRSAPADDGHQHTHAH